MTARYESITRWSIPRSVADATLRGVLRAARAHHEGGAFWLGRRSGMSEVLTVVLLEPPGVVEEAGYWEVSPRLFARVGNWADELGQVLLAVAHGHLGRGATWMSRLDRRGAVHVPDVLTVVVPAIAAVADIGEWGLHRFDGARFIELSPHDKVSAITCTDTPIAILHASEDGIRADI